MFSRDATVAVLLSLNKGTAAMLVSPTNPLKIELYSYANSFFCFALKTGLLITWVKKHYLQATWFYRTHIKLPYAAFNIDRVYFQNQQTRMITIY